jgi:hypothetical protein
MHLHTSSTTTPSEYISSGGRSLYHTGASGFSGFSTGSAVAARARDKTYSDMLDAEEENLGLDMGHGNAGDDSSASMSESEVGTTTCIFST